MSKCKNCKEQLISMEDGFCSVECEFAYVREETAKAKDAEFKEKIEDLKSKDVKIPDGERYNRNEYFFFKVSDFEEIFPPNSFSSEEQKLAKTNSEEATDVQEE